MQNPMPALFLGHGNPLNAVTDNVYAQGWRAIGRSLPRPKAVLAVSAHWYIPFSAVTSNLLPPTIHDFSGFPQELYAVRYPAPGDPELASRIRDLAAPVPVRLDDGWGLDHGTWSVLKHVIPEADVPVVQVSVDATQPPAFHYQLGKRLSCLREEGVLIVGSGNVVHNLRAYAWGESEQPPYDWARRFEQHVRQALIAGEAGPLVNYQDFGRDAHLSVPTPDHYLPLLFVIGARDDGEPASFPVEGVDGGSVSMLAVRLG